MPKREIGTKIKLDGEEQFKSSINNINQNLRVLSSEMGAVTSAYSKNSASVSNLKAKGEVLTKQLAEQKEKQKLLNQIVEAAEKSQAAAAKTAAEMAAKYGENSEQAQKAAQAVEQADKKLAGYRIQANNCTKSVNQLEAAQKANNAEIKKIDPSPLNKLKNEIAEVVKKAGEAAKELPKMAAKTITTGIDAAAKSVTAYAAAITAAATAAVALTSGAAAMADDINTLSKVTGVSTEQLQIMKMFSEQVDVSVETQAKALQKLTQNMSKAANGSKSTTEAFEALGISVRDDVTGELRSNDDVFAEAIEALGKIENETERDAAAMAVFGKSAAELNPLILGGAEELKKMGENAKEMGLVLSQEALDELNGFNDSLDDLKTNIGAAGNILAVSFSSKFKAFTDIIGQGAPAVIKDIAEMFKGGNVKELGKQLSAKLTAAGKEITKNISDMLPTFLSAFNAIILAVGVSIGETAPEALRTVLPQFLTGLNELVHGVIEQIPTFTPILLEGAVMLFTALLDGLNGVISQLTPMLPELVKQLTEAIKDGLPQMISGAAEFFAGLLTALAETVPELVNDLTAMIPVIVKSLLENLPLLIDAGLKLFIALVEALPEIIETIVAALPEIITAITDALTKSVPQIVTAGIELFIALVKDLPAIIKAIVEAIPQIIEALLVGFSEYFTQMEEVGKNLIISIGEGFMSGVRAVKDKITSAGDAIVNGFKEKFGIGGSVNVTPDFDFDGDYKPSGGGSGMSGGGKTTTINFNQYNSSPKTLNPREIRQQTQNGMQLCRMKI